MEKWRAHQNYLIEFRFSCFNYCSYEFVLPYQNRIIYMQLNCREIKETFLRPRIKDERLTKHIILLVIHWSVIVALIISAIIFVLDEIELANSKTEIQDGKILICNENECISYQAKTSITFLKIFIFEIIVAILALVALREGISLEKRFGERRKE